MKEKNIKILLFAALGLMSVVAIELVSGYASWINSSKGRFGFFNLASNAFEKISMNRRRKEVVTTSYWPSSPFVPHEKYGWWHKPGQTTVTLKSTGGAEYSFEMNFNQDGTRSSLADSYNKLAGNINSNSPYSVWIFGDSYLEGYGINDEFVFSSTLQAMRPEISFKNYACGGYGNAHVLLQLIDLKSKNLEPPEAIIVGYGDYYLERNVAAPSRIRTFVFDGPDISPYGESGFQQSQFSHPRAFFSENGDLEIENIPLFWEEGRSDLVQTTPSHQSKITIEIFKEIYQLSKSWGVERLYLAYLNGGEVDPVVNDAKRIGFELIDLRRNMGGVIDADGVPLDGHPGPLAHNTYARKIYKQLPPVEMTNDN